MQSIPNIVRDRLKATQPVANHPDANLLTAFAEQSLPAPERAAVLDHISRCGDCRDVVALALPATEEVTTATSARPAPAAWLTWPVLRWGLVAAGVVTIASLGLLQVQQRSAPQMLAYKVAVPESRSQAAEPPDPNAVKPANADKTAPSPTADSVSSSNAPVAEHKRMASPATPPAPARGNAFHGAAGGVAGGNLAFGPSAPSLSQQNNNVQQQMSNNTAAASTLNQPTDQASTAQKIPSGSRSAGASAGASLAMTEAKPEVGSRDQSADSQLQLAYAGPVAKAKLPVPTSPSGQIGGHVFDSSGAVVPNVRITITPSAIGGPLTAVTNSQGAWLVAGLPAGDYKAQAEAPGFNPTVLAFNYDANRPSIYNFTLSPGSVSETVEVAAAEQTVQAQTDAASVANTITNSQVSDIPLNGRSLTQFAKLSPGVPSPRWTITSKGSLQRSLDQGKTWQMVDVNAAPPTSTAMQVVAETSPAGNPARHQNDEGEAIKKQATTPIFRAITATGPEVWAGGSGGALYHSVDAGNSWVRVVPASSGSILTGDVVRLEFSDPQHGTITTSTPEVWTTSDGGQTWKKQ
jgi:hypothetical protein